MLIPIQGFYTEVRGKLASSTLFCQINQSYYCVFGPVSTISCGKDGSLRLRVHRETYAFQPHAHHQLIDADDILSRRQCAR